MRKTKIVCTLGPASSNKETFTELAKVGLNVARFNFSHGDHAEQKGRMDMVKEVREELDLPIAILLDTKGPEIRTGKFKEDTYLEEGSSFILTSEEYLGDATKCQITYEDLHKDVVPGDTVLIDDGLVGLRVEKVVGVEVHTTVLNGGVVKTKKGVNVPGVKINLPAITPKDREDILFGIEQGIDFIAASFIRKASDVLEIRKILEENGGDDIHIISKIENQEGVDNLDEILEVSDGLMVARGDLGVEIPAEQVPLVQKQMIAKCNRYGKPVITATQMLDSMIRNPRPTRAETTDVANAIFDGTDATMLSGETAAGKYPVESVKMMAAIAESAEAAIDYKELLEKRSKDVVADSVTFAVSNATVVTANELGAKAILTATSRGFTATRVAMLRPKAPVIAATVSDRVRRKLSLFRGVYTVNIPKAHNTDEIFEYVESISKKEGYIGNGDLVVITAGVPVGVAGATNLMKVHVVGELLIKGLGIGHGKYTAPVKIINSIEEAKAKFNPGDIIMTYELEAELAEYAKKAGGIITVVGGYTSAGAIAGISLGIPVVVGARNADKLLSDGMEITIDAKLGLVYSGNTRIK